MQLTRASAEIPVAPARPLAAALLVGGALWQLSPIHPPLVCPLRATTGIPCPFCGMTRAVTAAVRGDVAASLRYNPGGIVLVVLAIAVLVAPLLLRDRGVRLPTLRVPVVVLGAGAAALWAWNVAFNPTF
ncbi:MAG TPA: DUF2752 domain-containing protein [Acidimicrobiia bacterium]|nr:DUF2752 domain-containing protein [Acidimicrobiia bacterium]